jgi:hypothetical protein
MANSPKPAAGKACRFTLEKLRQGQGQAFSSLGLITSDQRIMVAGQDILRHAVPKLNLAQTLHLFIRKKIPSQKVAKILSGIVTAINYPDIRVWPIGAVGYAAAAQTSCGAAISAGILGFEARVFGVYAIDETSVFYDQIKAEMHKRVPLKTILKNWMEEGKIAFGFGRPIIKNDERVVAVFKLLKTLNFHQKPWIKLAFRIEKELHQLKGLRINFGGLLTAILKELKFSRREIVVFSNFFPIINYLGVFNEHENSSTPIFPMSCSDINYTGPELKDRP